MLCPECRGFGCETCDHGQITANQLKHLRPGHPAPDATQKAFFPSNIGFAQHARENNMSRSRAGSSSEQPSKSIFYSLNRGRSG